MEMSEFEHFRDLLFERRQNLTEWLNSGTSIRVDDARIVRELLSQIRDALGQIEDKSYGCCETCHDSIEPHRLEIQPVTRVCLGCISDEEKAVLEEDLFLASKIHRALLPQRVPDIDGFEVDVRSLAASNIGGDYYDFLPNANSTEMRIVIADAMGHGLPAGLLMSNLQGALRILSSDIDSPAPLVSRLNKWLCRNIPVTKFISMVCLCLRDTASSETWIRFANAGHCPPVVNRADGSVEYLPVTGGVLGVHENFGYEEQELTLYPGDYLTLFTDGVTEARNGRGEEYDQERLAEFIRSRQGGPLTGMAEDLIASVREFCDGLPAADDITVLVLRKK